jgi:adenosine deaminase
MDLWEAVETANPDRIGHGIYAAYEPELMKELVKRDIVLEICPLSNLSTKAVENPDEMKWIIRTLLENKVKITINTDWPEVIKGNHLHEQFVWLRDEGMMSEDELKRCNALAFESSFIPGSGLEVYL